MKIDDNGVLRDMTDEEEKEYLEAIAEQSVAETPIEDRIAELEEALDMLLSGVTE